MRRPEAFYRLYERRLARELDPARLPHHVGVLVDGNRRWARAFGATTEEGHRAGAERILDFIGWCDEVGVPGRARPAAGDHHDHGRAPR